jgi:hypothetical protein
VKWHLKESNFKFLVEGSEEGLVLLICGDIQNTCDVGIEEMLNIFPDLIHRMREMVEGGGREGRGVDLFC